MPNHWETSARPLFVKTVFVDGNRHAILFEKDRLRSGNPSDKKLSRSNSSLSLESNFSISSSENRDWCSAKQKHVVQNKDLSLDLQSCLVKLKLVSESLEEKSNSRNGKYLLESKDRKENLGKKKGNLKQKRHKWNNEKHNGSKRDIYYDGEKEYEFTGSKNMADNGCYIYDLENNKGKKKYCFVKISSQPSEFLLSCNCEPKKDETYNCDPSIKNFVISATIHNLFISSETNKQQNNPFECVVPFGNPELYWNNYMAKSYYNSYSDRVVQWLHLAKKQRKAENLIFSDEGDSSSNTERIFSRKTFVDEIKRTENKGKAESEKQFLRTERLEEEGQEVKGEPIIETFFSTENSRELCDGNIKKKNDKFKRHSISDVSNSLNKQLRNSTSVKSPVKIQDLLFNYSSAENLKNQFKKNREVRSAGKYKIDEQIEKNNDGKILSDWEKNTIKKGGFTNKFDRKQSQCHRKINLDDYTDKTKNQILTEEFAEINQKSINNLNITQTRPVLIQNLMPPQQPDKYSDLEDEKLLWASEKSKRRLQLHIFIPSGILKDQSDDSLSECENLLSL